MFSATGFKGFLRQLGRQTVKFEMQPRRRGAIVATLAVGGLLLNGCGNQYRPVVSAINPVGPAGQPTKYAVAISNTTPFGSAPTAGLMTIVDVSGDTILATPSVLPFPAPTTVGSATVAPTPAYVNPLYFVMAGSGSEGFLVNQNGLIETLPTSNPSSLLTQDLIPQTLAANTAPAGVQTILLPSTGQTIFVSQPTLASIAELQYASGASLIQNLSVPNPVYTVGADNAARAYAISGNGVVYPIENSPVSLDAPINVGTNPVYGLMSSDGSRVFIVNKGSGTITVINVPSNAIDAGIPAGTITLPNLATGGATAPNPVWADFLPATFAEMVVLNQGDGTHPGSLTTISIPLCNAQTPTTPANPNCSATNPYDAVGFGTIVNNVTVGINPSMVSVLQDGSRAYVVNQGILPGANASYPNGIEGSISVVNLQAGTVEATISGTSNPTTVAGYQNTAAAGTAAVANFVFGHPNTVVAVTGSPTGKVYTTSTDSQYLTVLETDTDSIITHISLQGTGIRVLATTK